MRECKPLGMDNLKAATIISIVWTILLTLCTAGITCPSRCSCYDNSVICTGSNQSVIPADIPAVTRFLYLDRNDITIVDRDAFSQAPELEVLTLERNRIHTIEEGAFNGVLNLKTLCLNSNNLSAISESTFGPLTGLIDLRLDNNTLVKISAGTFTTLPAITSLYIGGNRVDMVVEPGAFNGLTKLTTLSLSSSHIRELPKGIFTGLNSLESLDLSSNHLQHLESGICSGLRSLLRLRVDSNPIMTLDDGIFGELTHLLYLNLSLCSLKFFGEGLLHGMFSLKELWLLGNELGAIGDRVFCEVPHLSVLQLDMNPLKAIRLDSFRCLSELRDLHLSICSIDYIEHGALSWLSSLVSISLSGNHLMKLSPDAFQDKPNLSEVKCDFNRITSLNVTMFSGSPHLKSLLLNDNQISTLPVGIFHDVITPLTMTLRHNPLVCDCDLDWMSNWVRMGSGKIDRCECIQPPALHGRHVDTVEYDEFHCKPTATAIASTIYHAIRGGANFTMVCPVYGKPPPSIEWTTPNKNVISKHSTVEPFFIGDNGSLLITKVTTAHEGRFTCDARNILGIASAVIDLVVADHSAEWNHVSLIVPLVIFGTIVLILGVAIFAPKCIKGGCWKGKSMTRNGFELRYDPLGIEISL